MKTIMGGDYNMIIYGLTDKSVSSVENGVFE